MSGYDKYGLGLSPFGLRPQPVTKFKVFVSYHHKRDQAYYDRFATLFSGGFDIITDTSLDREIDSNSTAYVQEVIREQHITGSSVTVVLCGPETWKRRWVDWEIHMTLNKEHALLGIVLPTAVTNDRGELIVPDRLLTNINSGFAHWIHWTEDPNALRIAIDAAKQKARQTRNIDNSAPRMVRSRS